MRNSCCRFFTWWNGQTLGTRFCTWRFGKRVGEDEFGNVYYEGGMSSYGLPKRWVIYKGYAEASAIPPGWHGWMHHRTDMPPSKETTRQANGRSRTGQPTGTPQAYRPQGLDRRTGRTSARDRRLRCLDAGQLRRLDRAIPRPGFSPQLTFTRRLAALDAAVN